MGEDEEVFLRGGYQDKKGGIKNKRGIRPLSKMWLNTRIIYINFKHASKNVHSQEWRIYHKLLGNNNKQKLSPPQIYALSLYSQHDSKSLTKNIDDGLSSYQGEPQNITLKSWELNQTKM